VAAEGVDVGIGVLRHDGFVDFCSFEAFEDSFTAIGDPVEVFANEFANLGGVEHVDVRSAGRVEGMTRIGIFVENEVVELNVRTTKFESVGRCVHHVLLELVQGLLDVRDDLVRGSNDVDVRAGGCDQGEMVGHFAEDRFCQALFGDAGSRIIVHVLLRAVEHRVESTVDLVQSVVLCDHDVFKTGVLFADGCAVDLLRIDFDASGNRIDKRRVKDDDELFGANGGIVFLPDFSGDVGDVDRSRCAVFGCDLSTTCCLEHDAHAGDECVGV